MVGAIRTALTSSQAGSTGQRRRQLSLLVMPEVLHRRDHLIHRLGLEVGERFRSQTGDDLPEGIARRVLGALDPPSYDRQVDDALTIDEPSVADYLASISHEHISEDASALLAMMRRVSGHDPKLWSVGTIGFDAYHYRYDSGREGDSFVIGFYPGKKRSPSI
jgi:hypothetical protein